MGYPLSILENMLHNSSQPDSITIGEDTITIQQLIDFWIEGHKKLSGVTKFLKDAKIIMEKKDGQQEKSNEGSKGQKELQTEQQVERLQKKEVRRTNRKRLDYAKATD